MGRNCQIGNRNIALRMGLRILLLTRMHSSRMCTICCSGRQRGGGVSEHALGRRGVSAPVHAGIHTPLVDRILDTCL